MAKSTPCQSEHTDTVSAIRLVCMGMTQGYGPPPGDRQEIEEASAKVAIQGARYPDALERMTGS